MFYTQILNPIVKKNQEFKYRKAFCISEKYYTYGRFFQVVSDIRRSIRASAFNNKNVGLVVNDDIETYASIIALWLDGLCYVPLHPGWPKERCVEIIDQVEIDLIIDSSNCTRYEKFNVLKTINLPINEIDLNPLADVSTEDLAYILFTSGSTGKPKGVQLTRRNLGAFMDSFWKSGINVTEEDKCLQAFDLTFDVSVQSYLVALIKGACVYTIPYGQVKYVYAAGLINNHHITFGAMAPSMLRYMKPYFEELDAKSLKNCILTAEACPLKLMEDWFKCAYNADIYDFYGPTEATIYCTYYKLSRHGANKSLNGIISIGKPLANVIGIVIDEQGNELPNGEKGELCVAGDQVTIGYFNDQEKNLTAFFEKEYDGEKLRFYRTGDLCYKDQDCDIMYSGRLDYQAKIQGFRVEMGEIEHHARTYLGGINVVCLPFENSELLTEISMFIEKEDFDMKGLISYMRTKMPSYMIPTKIIFVPVFKLNSNDKIDKNVLRSML